MTADLGIVWDEHLPRMHRVALRIVGDADKAREAVQNACVNVVRRGDAFRGMSAPSTWLHRIVVNCALDQLRGEQRTDRRRADTDGELAGVLQWLGPTPDTAAELREMYRIVCAALEVLPADCRAAFVLTQMDGYTYDEVAAITQQPRGTIASRVHRAKRILLERLSVGAIEGEQQ